MRIVSSYMNKEIHFRFTPRIVDLTPLSLHQTNTSLQIIKVLKWGKSTFASKSQRKTCILVIKIHFRFTNHMTKIIPTLSLSLVGRFKHIMKRSKWFWLNQFLIQKSSITHNHLLCHQNPRIRTQNKIKQSMIVD